MALNIPPPTLPATTLPLSKPVVATLTGLKYADGAPVAAGDVSSIGMFAFRGPPGGGEIWDEGARKWSPIPANDAIMALKPFVGMPKDGSTASWNATLVAIGQTDAAGAKVYAAASGGTPQYYLRAFARAKHNGSDQTGLSAPTSAFTFVDPGANARFTTQFDTPDTQPDSAHRVRMLLKGDALQTAGYLEIRSQPSFEVEIANCDASGNTLAKVLLRANGEIHLMPANGARVIVESDLETNRILYAPFGGGPKVWLP